jgi:uncharacterized protein (TIGR00156 family)
MQKLLYLLPMMLLFGVNAAAAQGATGAQSGTGSQEKSGMPGKQDKASAPPVSSANGVAAAKDNQPAKLRGQIVGQQGKNQYVFADDTGNAVVEIDNKVLKGQSLAAGTQVEIQGEVDKSIIRKQAKVDAKSVTVLASNGNPSGSSSSSSPSSSSPSGSGAPMNERQPEERAAP